MQRKAYQTQFKMNLKTIPFPLRLTLLVSFSSLRIPPPSPWFTKGSLLLEASRGSPFALPFLKPKYQQARVRHKKRASAVASDNVIA